MKNKYFFIDSDLKVSFEDLRLDINQAQQIDKYCCANDYYSIFKHVILSLLIDKPITLLDIDMSETEIDQLTNGVFANQKTYTIPKLNFKSVVEIIEKVKSAKNWRLNLYTSGTTGKPKRVAHTFDTLTRNVKVSEKHSNDIWGFSYNPTHMAGIQVFFQAFLNQNQIIRLFQIDHAEIVRRINSFNISNISATSTYYRLLLPIEPPIATVKQITFGGEMIDTITKHNLEKAFPNARILNIYASTEAGTLFTSKNDVFSVRGENENLLKIEKNELFIHSKLLGESDAINLLGEWYPTGDMVEIVSEEPLRFKFLSRKGEVINVGGYNINPHEVEEVLIAYEGIVDAYVFAKKNRITGNIIMAEIITTKKNLEIPDLYKYIRSQLQEFKVPRVINIVDVIQKTNTGKKKRS